MPDRKTSPLADDDEFPGWPAGQPPTAPPAKPKPAPKPTAEVVPPPQVEWVKVPDTVQTRSRRRRQPTATVDDFDMVPFNCKLTRIARRMIRTLAAEKDVDIQDVIEDMAVEYFARRGQELPRRPLPDPNTS